MSQYVIVTESTADLTQELVERYDLAVIPMRFCVGDIEFVNYPDNRELAPKDFYNMLREGKTSTTSAVNMADFEEFFTPILESGKDILYLGFSSALSSTYGTSIIAAESLREKFPERKIINVDTKCASMGEGLIVCKAAKLRSRGMSIQEVAEWVENNRENTIQWFTVDDLMHLYRGGRVSAISAHMGTALGIKPLLHVDDEGYLKAMQKVRGRKKSLDALCDVIGEKKTDMTAEMVFISHADCAEDADYLANLIAEKYSPDEICIGDIGPVVGSHTGPGGLAMFFFGKVR